MNRKEFLQKLGLLGIVGMGSTTLLNSCGEQNEKSESASGAKTGDPCGDTSGLTEIDIKTRENLKYVEKSTDPAKECTACNFWLPPEGEKPCGGCQLVKGPINPQGSCISFAPKPKQS